MIDGNVAGILVVEDEPDLAALMTDLLHTEGYRVAVAQNGREALDFAANAHPALVVLDLALPDIGGRDVLRLLKSARSTADIPVIVVSAYVGRLNSEDKALLGAVFEKPFDLEGLLAAIRRSIIAAGGIPAAPDLRERAAGDSSGFTLHLD